MPPTEVPTTVADSRGGCAGVLAANNIAVIKDTHGKTSHLSASHIEALGAYLRSLKKTLTCRSALAATGSRERQRLQDRSIGM